MIEAGDHWNQLVEGLRKGAEPAVTTFAREAGAWLRGFMAKWLPEHEDFEQAALDVLVEAMAKFDRFDSEKASLKTWIRCIASRRVADYYRSRERETAELPGKRENIRREKFHLKQRLVGDAKLVMLEVIAGLDPADLELLRLFFDERLPDSAVAEALGISPGNARQRKMRIIAKLQKTISKNNKPKSNEPGI